MSVSMTNLFNYARSLPAPFDTLPGKKVKVSSKYSHGTEATLFASVIKAVNAACCMNSGGEGAIGTVGEHKYAAEYKSSAGTDTFHIVVYESVSGNIVASVYDRSTEVIEQYTAHPSKHDGAALFLAMLPALMEDEEFAENYRAYSYQLKAGFPDMGKAVNAAALFCDNAYRRIKDDGCPAHVKVNIDKSGNLMRISRTQLDSGAFTPTSVIAGEFTIFARTGHSEIKAAGPVIDHADFVGKYVLDETRTLSAFERSLVPELPEWYIIPPEVVSICRHAQATSGKAMPMRNFLLRGPAGTGKTMGAKAIAAGLGLPYMKYTCSAGTEIFDFVGMVFPQTDKAVTADAQTELNYAGVSKLLNLPDLDDMDYDPEGVFKSLTGVDNPHATTQDCMAVVLDMVTSKAFELSAKREGAQNPGQAYTYVETDFIKALKYGYVVEIQEPSTIMQPGVLVGLNSLLEQGGSITLPTGEVIRRHPDAVVIVTTNVSYEGCRAMNQSVTDRMSLIEDIELPEPDVMLQRAMAVTGCEDEYLVARMVQVVCDITAYCRRNGITDGSSGMRGLIDWITSTEISGDPYRSALCTVISRAAPDEEDREALISAVLEPIFAPGRRMRWKEAALLARVNHKLVRRLMDEKRSKISDRQFFTSRVLALHFEDMAVAQTRRYSYNRRVRVRLNWEPKSGEVTCTDNLTIRINAGNEMVTQNRTRAKRYEIVSGLFAHELGHCLFTDFLSAQMHSNCLASHVWYPEKPKLTRVEDIRSEQALWDFINTHPEHMNALVRISKYIANVLEDGYIENRMLAQFPGVLGQNLSILREQQWETVPTVTQLKEREAEGGHIMQSVLQLLLSYVKYGELKYGEEPLSDERIQLVFGLLPELDCAVVNPSARERLNTVNLVLIRCWEYIRDFIETHGDKGASDEAVSKALEAIEGSSQAGTGNEIPVDGGEAVPLMTGSARAGTMSDAGITGEYGEQTETDNPAAGEAPERLPYEITDSVSVPEGGGVERDDSYEPSVSDDAAKAIERLLDSMAEKAVCEQLENERLSELNEAAQGVSYGNVHKGVSIRINRMASVSDDMVSQYKSVSGPLLTISRQLQKSLMQQLRDRRRGGRQTGLMMGRRLDAHALCRNDGKVFYKNALPSETPELAVALLLDESGSMWGERSDYARASGIILHDFCASLGIPVMVYGHSTEGSTVMLYSYAEFDSIDGDDRYRLMDVKARSNNRDGAVLRFVAEQLVKRPEEVKLLILVSDGQPSDNGYYGSAAEEDLRGIKLEYRRRGVIFIAAAIGDDKRDIERIYGDSFLDITDLTQLPVKLTNMVKRYIRV